MTTRAILVVEDEPGIAEIIEFILNDEPRYQATTVPDGATAPVFLAEVRIDLIILDINLPGLDGFAIHDLIRALAETATTPILFMTATDHSAEFARRGIADWIKKPFDLDDLLEEVVDRLGDQATDRPGHP